MKANKVFRNKYLIGILLLLTGLFLGWLFFHHSSPGSDSSSDETTELKTIWTCSMHPQIRMDKPGKCPLCDMDLIPLVNSDASIDDDAIQMSDAAIKLAEIQTSIVSSGAVNKEVRLYGKIQADERQLQSQTAHVPGRIERLLVSITGEKIYKGQLIAKIYSPELVNAQNELLEAVKLSAKYPSLLEAAREKLRLWKLTDKQIESIETSGEIITTFNIYANTSGVLVSRKVSQGDYVNTGDVLFDVANLSVVWGVFDAYESDLAWISLGQSVEYTTQAIPGKVFKGTVSFIDPVIDPIARVARVRIEIPNYNGQFKPEMFLNGTILAKTSGPKDQLTIPQSAVLWTGKRSIVYVKVPGSNPPAFKMREITLGPTMRDFYIVEDGLTEGEEIVTNGAFSVDAAAQLAGKPSMMNQTTTDQLNGNKDNASDVKNEINSKFKDQLTNVFTEYIKMKDAFVKSDKDLVSKSARTLQTVLSKTDKTLLDSESKEKWSQQIDILDNTVNEIFKSSDIEAQRKLFITFNNTFYHSIKDFGLTNTTVYYQYCPMANNNKGAYWMSNSKEIRNPYFGDKMLKCGEVKETIK